MSKATSCTLPADRDQLLLDLKRYAKDTKKQNQQHALAWFLDTVAASFNFKNWSGLHKNVRQMTQPQFDAFSAKVHTDPGMCAFLAKSSAGHLLASVNEDAVKEEMREWVRARYTPLVEFAPLDNESETGFAFDAEDIFVALQEEFGQQYPFEWIDETAAEMEIEGPWGLPEKYGPYDSDVDAEPPTAGADDNWQRDDLSFEHEDYSDRL